MLTTTPTSSLIATIDHRPDATLEIEFHNGSRYRYFLVPAALVRDLLAADSVGAFFNRYVRGRFRHERIAL